MKPSRLLALIAVAVLAAAAPAPEPPDAAVVAWVQEHAVPLGPADSALSPKEAAVVERIIAGARVIGLGEPFHGHEEPLTYRNRLVRYLVAHEGLTAVALESGMAETRRVDAFVQGGPGEAKAVVRANLSWRFNDLVANAELADWMRAWNQAHPARTVRLYGIDVSGGDAKVEFGRSRVSIDSLVEYLGRAGPGHAAALRARLEAFAGRFSNAGYAAMNAADRAALHETLSAARSFLDEDRAALTAATSAQDFAWAQRIAGDTLDAERIFAVWPADPAKPLPGAMLVSDIRDRAMAANTLWALAREGPRGRILLFESSTHVGAAPMRPPGREREAGSSAGQELRRALGGGYRVIVTASSLGKAADDPAIGSVDRVLAAAGRPRALLDIRDAPDWWDRPQTLAHGGARVNALVPRRAFDGIVYVDALQPARLLSIEGGK